MTSASKKLRPVAGMWRRLAGTGAPRAGAVHCPCLACGGRVAPGLSLRVGGGGGEVRNANRNVHVDALRFMAKTWARHKTTETVLNNGSRLAAVGGWWSSRAVLNQKKNWGSFAVWLGRGLSWTHVGAGSQAAAFFRACRKCFDRVGSLVTRSLRGVV